MIFPNIIKYLDRTFKEEQNWASSHNSQTNWQGEVPIQFIHAVFLTFIRGTRNYFRDIGKHA